jgi:acyl-CoA thioesterase
MNHSGPETGNDGSRPTHSPRAVADVMFANDAASQAMGMEIVDVTSQTAVVRMTVRADMVNGLDVCHGGIIFSLADSAMAFLSNGGNQYAIASHGEIDWISPGRLGSVLTATATRRHTRGRNTITDAVVTDEHGEVVAHFRGRTRLIDGQHLP